MATLPPLTHHEILELCAPLSRTKQRMDLPASDRGARRVVFQPVDRAGLRETLTLHNPYAGVFTLTRTLVPLASAERRGAPFIHVSVGTVQLIWSAELSWSRGLGKSLPALHS